MRSAILWRSYFVAQRQQFDVLGSLGTGEQEEQPEEADKGEIDHAERHGARACHDRGRASKSQVEAGTRVMAPHRPDASARSTVFLRSVIRLLVDQ